MIEAHLGASREDSNKHQNTYLPPTATYTPIKARGGAAVAAVGIAWYQGNSGTNSNVGALKHIRILMPRVDMLNVNSRHYVCSEPFVVRRAAS